MESVISLGHTLMVDLNVCLGGINITKLDAHALGGSDLRLGGGGDGGVHPVGLTLICSKEEVALSDILAVVDCLDFALDNLAEIVLLVLAPSHSPVVNLITTEIVVGDSVHIDALFLSLQRLSVDFAEALFVCITVEEVVVLVSGGVVVD